MIKLYREDLRRQREGDERESEEEKGPFETLKRLCQILKKKMCGQEFETLTSVYLQICSITLIYFQHGLRHLHQPDKLHSPSLIFYVPPACRTNIITISTLIKSGARGCSGQPRRPGLLYGLQDGAEKIKGNARMDEWRK
uniref:Uncharacterized protein n=1 Tax=Periophthalmus magnuspinnatus TaxID=409849 RepID=A0A3B4AP25_9GOBI